jgi:hypothetical protein
MKKQKNIHVPVEFLAKTYLLVEELYEAYELGAYAHELCERLRYLIDEKFAAMKRRNTFTCYITSLPRSTEREMLRNAYLDLVYCHQDWRSSVETYASFFDNDVPF